MMNPDTGEDNTAIARLKTPNRRAPARYFIGFIRNLPLFAFLLLAACVPAAATPEPITLVFAYPEGMMDSDYYGTLAAEFTVLHPHITIEVTPDGWETADVIMGPEWVLRQAQQESGLVSLDAFIEQEKSFDLDDFYPNTLDQLTFEGETWAIPAGVEMALMFFNRDLFDRYGVLYPEPDWTWNEFLDTAAALRHPDEDVFGYVPWGGNVEYLDAVTFVYQHGGKLLDDWRNPDRTTFDDPLTLEALEWYAGLFQKHEVAPTPTQVSQAFMGQVDTSIVMGKAGMWIDSLMSREQAGEDWDFELGIASLPRDAESNTLAWVYGYAITRRDAHLEESWLWIDFLSRQISSRLAPARRSLAESAEYGQLMGSSAIPIRHSLEDASMVSYWTMFSRFGSELRQFQNAMERIVKGEATPKELLERSP